MQSPVTSTFLTIISKHKTVLTHWWLLHPCWFANLLMKNIADNLDGKGKRYLTHINNNTEKMSRIIDDLLTFQDLKTGVSTVIQEDVEKSRLINSMNNYGLPRDNWSQRSRAKR